jgi:hypothetical protein
MQSPMTSLLALALAVGPKPPWRVESPIVVNDVWGNGAKVIYVGDDGQIIRST